jgi:CRP-like cAMP-binding protein
MTQQDFATFLGQIELFQGLTREELHGLDHLSIEHTYEPGQVVIKQGSQDRDIYVVVDGSAEAEIATDGQRRHLATFTPQQFFGEIAMVDHEPRSATVKAGSNGLTALRIAHTKLEAIMENNHHIGYIILRHIAAVLCERIRATNAQAGDTITWGQ